VAVLRAGARRALADGAAGLAADYLRRALDEPPPTGQRPEVLSELGTAERVLDAPRAAGHLREALALTGDPAQRVQIALALGRALLWAGQTGELAAVFEEALADPSLDAAQLRSLETGLVVLGLFEPELVRLERERLGRFDLKASTPATAMGETAAGPCCRAVPGRSWALRRGPRRADDGPGHAIVKIAIYPDVVWLAARSLRAHGASHRTASVPFR
jgi:hypothetical protein